MIHTNELMLGNWVEYSTGLNGEKRSIPMYVRAIDEDEVLLSFDGNEADPFVIEDKELLGIPITEELLEKCGFIKTPGSGGYTNDKVNATPFLTDGTTVISSNCGLTIGGINFLHELQNAYFFLTKEHLEVKL